MGVVAADCGRNLECCGERFRQPGRLSYSGIPGSRRRQIGGRSGKRFSGNLDSSSNRKQKCLSLNRKVPQLRLFLARFLSLSTQIPGRSLRLWCEFYPLRADVLTCRELPCPLVDEYVRLTVLAHRVAPIISDLQRIRFSRLVDQVCFGSQIRFATVVTKTDLDRPVCRQRDRRRSIAETL